jgi:hypothetical protein
MKLEQIIADLENTSNSLTICAAKSPQWSRTSEAELCPSEQVPRGCKLPYFLEVSVAKNVFKAWSFARNGRIPTIAKKCEALIYYAENDAYILPEHEPNE